MAPKSLVLLAAALLLVAAVGQVRGALVPLPGIAAAISGIVPCSIGSNINVTAVPPFANATVQALCGSTVVATATTGATGAFNMSVSSISNLAITGVLYPLLSGQCKVAVTTTLVTCNVSLGGATGTLTAPLQLLNTTTGGGGGGVIPTTTIIFGIIVQLLNNVISLFAGSFSSI